MNKNKQITRPASVPTPQGNPVAKLIKGEGNEAEAPVIEMSLDLSIFRYDVPSENEEISISRSSSLSDDSGFGALSFSRVALLEAKLNAEKIDDFIDYCETAYKGLKKAAEALIEPHMPTYLEWAKLYRPTQNVELKHKNRTGAKVVLTPEDFDDSVESVMWLMAKISNTKLFGKAATKSKAATPSIFYNPKSVSKLAGFEGKSEKVRAMANVEFLMFDQSGDIEYFFTQIGELARFVLHNNEAEANEIWRKLTGKVVADKRVVFPEPMIQDITQARMYGSLAAMFSEEGRKAKEGKYKLQLTEAEAARLEEYRRNVRIALNKAEDMANEPKVEKIAGSNVQSPESRATLPQATLTPKTLEEIARNKVIKLARRQADTEMQAAITRGELSIDNIEACQAFWEAANLRILKELDEIEELNEATEADAETTDAETTESN